MNVPGGGSRRNIYTIRHNSQLGLIKNIQTYTFILTSSQVSSVVEAATQPITTNNDSTTQLNIDTNI